MYNTFKNLIAEHDKKYYPSKHLDSAQTEFHKVLMNPSEEQEELNPNIR